VKPLTYWERGVRPHGEVVVFYRLKPAYMTPRPQGNRHFFVFMTQDGQTAISQTDEPANPGIPLAAWLELAQIVDDWREARAQARQERKEQSA